VNHHGFMVRRDESQKEEPMIDVTGAGVSAPANTDLTHVGAYTPPKVGACFDPTEEIALIRALAYNTMHGDLEAKEALAEEISRLHRTPFEAVIAMELSKPDKTKKLPVATYELDGDGPAILCFNFHPGCLDFKSRCPVLSVIVA
jgi:hypothetical protein